MIYLYHKVDQGKKNPTLIRDFKNDEIKSNQHYILL